MIRLRPTSRTFAAWLSILCLLPTGLLPMQALVVCRAADGSAVIELSHTGSHDHNHQHASCESHASHASCDAHHENAPCSNQPAEPCDDDSLATDHYRPADVDVIQFDFSIGAFIYEQPTACDANTGQLCFQSADPPGLMSLQICRSFILQL